MTPSACPESGCFDALRRGTLAAEEVERLACHLETCERCAAQAEESLNQASFVQALRTDCATPPASEQDALVLKTLMLRVLCDAAAPHRISPGTADDMADLLAQLAPAQAPGEIARLGSYRLRRLIGAGGMALVFQAEDSTLGRAVALKLMRPNLSANLRGRERFLREARAAAKLRHDHVVTLYQAGEDAGVAYIAMELLTGESLAERLARPDRMTTGEIVPLGKQIAFGLAAAHAAGLVHRDVKPSNIWLDAAAAGRVKLLDFGLARPVAEDVRLTQTALLMGTPSYLAPEQAGGDPVDHRADLFSLGCVLYEMAAGRLPFRATTVQAALKAVALDTPEPLTRYNPELPPGLVELVMRLLSKDPAQRPASAQMVSDALITIETGTPLPTTRPNHWRLGIVTTASLALVLLGVGVGRFFLGNGREPQPSGMQSVAAPVPPTDPAEAWEKSVAGLAPEALVHEVTLKLRELNPGYQGSLHPTIDGNEVIGLELTAVKLTNLTPLHALPALQRLDCQLSKEAPGNLTDLKPLQGLPLKSLNLRGNFQLKDLSPLETLPLESLNVYACSPVTDLGPLRRMRTLRELDCGGTHVIDLGPLRGLSLTWLSINDTKVENIGPLEGMSLITLSLGATRVVDLGPLRNMRTLKFLNLNYAAQIKDLRPLQDLPVCDLFMAGSNVHDLSPLRNMQVKSLGISPDIALANRQFLLSISTLKDINYKPTETFWKELEEKPKK